MKVFIDSDVLLDIYLMREEHYEYSAQVLDLVFEKKIQAITSPVVIANIFYILKKTGKAETQILSLLESIKVIAVDHAIMLEAFTSKFTDKEDAIQYFTAIKGKATYLITRNVMDYKKAIGLTVLTPADFINNHSN